MRRLPTPPIALLVGLTFALPACGGDDAASDWQPLITGDWSLSPGSEDWYCTSKTLDQDLYIGALRPIDPLGTHHGLLTYGPPEGPDQGAAPCDPNSTRPFPLYGSGIHTNALELPEGIGFKIAAGQQIHLNLHLFNTGDTALSGTSGVEIQTVAADAIEHEAEMFLPGPFGFQIPQAQEYSYASNCDITDEQHVFALFPHMHQLGKHLKTEITVAGETRTLWDEDYQFEAQTFTTFEPITFGPGDRIRTTCTWFFPSDPDRPDVIGWGNSSNEEMCFSMMMRYPRLILGTDGGANCTDEALE